MDRKIRKLLVSGIAAATVLSGVAGCSATNDKAATSQTILTPPETAAIEAAEETGLDIAHINLIPFDYENMGNAEMVWKTSVRDFEDFYTERGYYVYKMKNRDYPFMIDIFMGQQDADGYAIEIIDVTYDGSEMIITVRETAPDDDAEAGEEPGCPGCKIELSRYPDSLKIVNEDGDEFPLRFSNVVKAVGDWDCYFTQADENARYSTYVTRTEDGRYKYINVCETTDFNGLTVQNVFGKFETGIVDTKEEIVEIAKEYGSCGTVVFRDGLIEAAPDDFLTNENI